MCDEKAPSANREEIDCAQVAIELLHAAERELGSFVSAVRELFGAEQVPQAIEDWMQELIAIDWPRFSNEPNRCYRRGGMQLRSQISDSCYLMQLKPLASFFPSADS